MGRKGRLHQTKSVSGKAARMDRIVVICTTAVPGNPCHVQCCLWLGPMKTHCKKEPTRKNTSYSDANLIAANWI